MQISLSIGWNVTHDSASCRFTQLGKTTTKPRPTNSDNPWCVIILAAKIHKKANSMQKCATFIVGINNWIGQTVAWLVGLMVLCTFATVILRHGFDIGWIALQEASLYLHAIVFMLGAAYTLSHDSHVRVDIFYQRFGHKGKAIINAVGVLVLLLPMCGFIFWQSLGYVMESWSVFESSPEAGGLPGVYLLKSLIPVTAALLMLQGVAIIINSLYIVTNNENFTHKQAQ